jgi:hypothetical protein
MHSSTPSILTKAALLYYFLLRILLRDLKPSNQLIDHFSSGVLANIGIRYYN